MGNYKPLRQQITLGGMTKTVPEGKLLIAQYNHGQVVETKTLHDLEEDAVFSSGGYHVWGMRIWHQCITANIRYKLTSGSSIDTESADFFEIVLTPKIHRFPEEYMIDRTTTGTRLNSISKTSALIDRVEVFYEDK